MPTHHRQSQQYFLALIGFFAVAELETLRLWVDAAMVPGPSTGSHDCIVECRFWALMACCTKV